MVRSRIQAVVAASALAAILLAGPAPAGTVNIVDASGTTVATLTSASTFYGYIATNGCGADGICAPAASTSGPVIPSDAPFSLDTTVVLTATAFDFRVNAPPPPGATGLTGGNNPVDEAATLSAVVGIPILVGVQTLGNGGDMNFSVSSQYFSVAFGSQTAFFRNDSGGILQLFWDAVAGEGAGLSHYTQYVPVPMVGAGLPGLVLACGGLIVLARRRKARLNAA